MPRILEKISRTVLLDCPAAFGYAKDWYSWVGPPMEYTENSGKILRSEAPCWPTIMGASLQCEPYYLDWSTVGTLHVFDVEVVPEAVYEVRAIGAGCDLSVEENYGEPLSITTSKWGDVVGFFDGQVWTAPNG